MKTKILYLFTRTPLHVGAGVALGAIDRPIIRERHTSFPFIPGSTLKGALAQEWTELVKGKDADGRETATCQRTSAGIWLFGAPASSELADAAGALQFSEAKLLALPIRSARGSFAWVTSPHILRRYARDGGMKGYQADGTLDGDYLPKQELRDHQAIFNRFGPLALGDKVVLEDYTLSCLGELPGSMGPANSTEKGLAEHLKSILAQDPVWMEIAERLVIVNDGVMTFLAQSACMIAQHLALDDAAGTGRDSQVYNQENVPAETMFYACVNCFEERTRLKPKQENRTPEMALAQKLAEHRQVFQFGADAGTGLGYCSVELLDAQGGL